MQRRKESSSFWNILFSPKSKRSEVSLPSLVLRVGCAAVLCGVLLGANGVLDGARASAAAARGNTVKSAEDMADFLLGYGVEADAGTAQVLQVTIPRKFYIIFKAFNEVIGSIGMDLTKEMPEMMPAAHTNIGGVIIDGKCGAGVEGLYACGEVIGGLPFLRGVELDVAFSVEWGICIEHSEACFHCQYPLDGGLEGLF